jgi:hypothetical protein
MSGPSVSISVAPPRHCRHTGVTIPECCCRGCCRALVRRYAPALPEPTPEQLADRLLAQPILTLEQYARCHGLSLETVRRQAKEREVQI